MYLAATNILGLLYCAACMYVRNSESTCECWHICTFYALRTSMYRMHLTVNTWWEPIWSTKMLGVAMMTGIFGVACTNMQLQIYGETFVKLLLSCYFTMAGPLSHRNNRWWHGHMAEQYQPNLTKKFKQRQSCARTTHQRICNHDSHNRRTHTYASA